MKTKQIIFRLIQTSLFLIFTLSISAQNVTVSGKKIWTDTGIDVWAGQTISISATGTVYANAGLHCGPDGFLNKPGWDTYCVIKGKPHEGLILKIGTGKAVFVGKSFKYTAKENGRIWLGVNDNDVGNNKGEFSVKLSINNETLNNSYSIIVSGKRIWTDTEIDVWAGQSINTYATGVVFANASKSCGPEGFSNHPEWNSYCVVKGKPHEGLIMKIGDGTPFFIGKSNKLIAKTNGRIWMGVNDNDVGNNKGEYRVELSLNKENNHTGVGDFNVSGTKSWTSSGLNVTKGQFVKISATGKVYANASTFGNPDGIKTRPDWDIYCIVKGKPHIGLIAKIGNGKPFFVGSSHRFNAKNSGELFFRVNDTDLGNNKGSFSVSVEIK